MSNEPLYRESPRRRAKRLLLEQIDRGVLAIGAELPVERDLAKHFELPRATVSRAIADLQEEGVIRHVRGRTRVVVGRPAKVVNQGTRTTFADGLQRATVVVLAPPLSHPELPTSLGSPDWLTLAATTALRAAGHHALVLDSGRVSASELTAAASSGYGGIVLAAINLGTRVEIELMRTVLSVWRAHGVPVAVFGDELADHSLDRVAPDHRTGARLLVEWLIAHGRTRIRQQSFIGLDTPWWRERRAGYEDGMRAAGLQPLPPLAMPHDERGEMTAASLDARASVAAPVLQRLDDCDAVMAVTDSACFPLHRAWRMMGRDTTGLMLVGYDHVAAECWERTHEPLPTLISVDRYMGVCGQTIIDLLLRRMRDAHVLAERRLIAPAVVSPLAQQTGI